MTALRAGFPAGFRADGRDGLELGPALDPGPEDGGHPGVLSGQEVRGDAGGGPGGDTITIQNGNHEITVNGDDAMTVTAVYDLYQNVALHANYSTYSGSAYNAPGSVTNLLTLMLEAAW